MQTYYNPLIPQLKLHPASSTFLNNLKEPDTKKIDERIKVLLAAEVHQPKD